MSRNTIGYGPSQAGHRWLRLLFDSDDKSYELWETRFLAHMELRGLRDVVLESPEIDSEDEEALAEDEAKNGQQGRNKIQNGCVW